MTHSRKGIKNEANPEVPTANEVFLFTGSRARIYAVTTIVLVVRVVT